MPHFGYLICSELICDCKIEKKFLMDLSIVRSCRYIPKTTHSFVTAIEVRIFQRRTIVSRRELEFVNRPLITLNQFLPDSSTTFQRKCQIVISFDVILWWGPTTG